MLLVWSNLPPSLCPLIFAICVALMFESLNTNYRIYCKFAKVHARSPEQILQIIFVKHLQRTEIVHVFGRIAHKSITYCFNVYDNNDIHNATYQMVLKRCWNYQHVYSNCLAFSSGRRIKLALRVQRRGRELARTPARTVHPCKNHRTCKTTCNRPWNQSTWKTFADCACYANVSKFPPKG